VKTPAIRAALHWFQTAGGGGDREVIGYVQFKEMMEEMNWSDVTSTEFEETHPALQRVRATMCQIYYGYTCAHIFY
jgi:hypothetical protein